MCSPVLKDSGKIKLKTQTLRRGKQRTYNANGKVKKDNHRTEMPKRGKPTKAEILSYSGASLVAQTVKKPPVMQETWVQSLGREDPLEKGVATQSSILALKIPWAEEPGGLQSMGSQRVRHD